MTTVTPTSAAPNNRRVTPVTAHPSPPKHSDRMGLNEKAADLIAKFVGSMWMFYPSVIGFAIWMAGLGVTVAGDHHPFNLMLLAVGGLMQWLRDDRHPRRPERSGRGAGQQVEHLHQFGVRTHPLVMALGSLTAATEEM